MIERYSKEEKEWEITNWRDMLEIVSSHSANKDFVHFVVDNWLLLAIEYDGKLEIYRTHSYKRLKRE